MIRLKRPAPKNSRLGLFISQLPLAPIAMFPFLDKGRLWGVCFQDASTKSTAEMLGKCVQMPVGHSDMSNRPRTGWQLGSMSMMMKIMVIIFVSMLCFVGFAGAFSMIGKKDGSVGEQAECYSQAHWFLNLDSLEDKQQQESFLIYNDPQTDLSRPAFIPHYKKAHSSHDQYAALAKEKLAAALEALRPHNLTFVIHVIGWRRRASLKRLIKSLEETNYHGFSTKLHFHLDGEAHPLVKEFVEEYEWPHGKTLMNLHTERLGLESVN